MIHPYSGIGVYTHQMLQYLSQNKSLKIFIIVYGERKKVAKIEEMKNVIMVRFKKPRFLPMRLYLLWIEKIAITKCVQKLKPDFYFSPFPHVLSHEALKQTKCFMTLHDVFLLKNSEYTKSIFRKGYNFLLKKTLKKAHLITVSKESSKEIKQFLHIKHSPVIIPNGIDHLLGIKAEKLKNKFKKPYIFYHGGYDSRKNILYLLEVFEKVRKYREVNLILGGEPLFDSDLYTKVNTNKHIIQTGFLDNSELVTLYRNAECFVHLSSAEGFNIPIGEALSLGTKVVCSDIPVHREFWQTHATFVTLKDAEKAAHEIIKVLDHKSKKQTLNLSWELASQKLLDLFM